MQSIDTNILARAILGDDDKQSPIAREFIKKNTDKGIYISAFTIVELIWLIKSKVTKKKLCAILEQLLQTEGFLIGQKHLLIAALHEFKNNNGDFADYVIVNDGLLSANTDLTSFDKKLCTNYDHATLLK